MRTDNTMMKPQLAWWNEIDNSYYLFIPKLEVIAEKVVKSHGRYPVQEETLRVVLERVKDP